MEERTTTVDVDEQGRCYIPKPVRESLGFDGRSATVELTVRVVDNE